MSDLVTHTQLVFLVDVNKNNYDSSSNDPTCAQKYVNTICLSVLRLLVHFASETEGLLSHKSSKSKNKQSSLKWGFKFFNSSHHHSRVGGHILRDFKLRYFEEFENEIERKFEETFNERKSEKAHNASDCLRKALMEVIYDFQWEKPDITSPVKRRKSFMNRDDVTKPNNNLVFVFSRFPENPTVLRQFAGKKVIDADVCLDLFMPESLYREFHGLYQLQLFWVDCYDILTRPGIDPKSFKLFEETLNKIGGHLIPAEVLVQLCDRYVTNIDSFFPKEAFEKSSTCVSQHNLPLKQGNCVADLGNYGEAYKTEVSKKASQNFRPVLPFAPIVYNLLNYCQNSRLGSGRNSSGGEECQTSLLTQHGQKICRLEVLPMYNKSTNLSQNAQVSTDTNIREVDIGEDNVLCLETDIVRKALLARGGAQSLRVCGVLVSQWWSQLDWTAQQQCVCTAAGDDMAQSVLFKQLLTRLHQEKTCLLLEVKGHTALVILKPLTTVSASLTLLSVGRTLALEKSLFQESVDSRNTEVCAFQKKGGPSWPELITRLTAKQQSSRSRRKPDGACFDPTVVGKAYLPGCHKSFGHLLHKLNQRISQIDFLSPDEKKTLGELQQLYRYENQPPHLHSHTGVQDGPSDKTSIAQEEDRKGQGSMASRGEMMVTRSRQAITQKDKEEKETQDSDKKVKPKTDNLLSKADFADEGELVTYLLDVYNNTVSCGKPSLSVCGQTIVTVALHYLKEREDSKPQERCIQMLEQTIILPLTGLREKYSSKDVEKQKKIREYQLQVLLRLECESMLSAGDLSGESEADSRVDQVVNLLRTLGFVTDPATLSEFMSGTLVDLYLHTLPHVLGNIYDELMQPLPGVLEDILSPDHSADQSVFSQSLLKSDNPASNQSMDVLDPSNQSDVLLNRPKRNTRRHTLVHHPSLAEVGPKRQIMVRKMEKKKMDKQSHKKSHHPKRKTKDPGSGEKVCRNLFENKKTKLERRQSVAVMENLGKSRHHHGKRLPNLKSPKALKSPFKSQTFRNKKVSETPAHKQKCQAVFSRIEKERHRSKSITTVEVVEESPVKACFEPADSPSQRKRAMAMLRRSFYSAGPTKRSRNLVKYFQLADRMAGRPPVNRLSSGASLHDLSAEFRSPDKNSSLIFSQLIGSPTPPKSTPNKMVITPAKHLLESPSMHTRSRSPGHLEGTPRKHIFGKSLLESPCMNTRSKSPGFSQGLPKVLFGNGSSSTSIVFQDQDGVSLKDTPVKSDHLVAESPSQNTRSKTTGTPKRSSRAKMFLFKSPENKASSLRSISTNISSSKCLNLSKFESEEKQNDEKDNNFTRSETGSVINLSWLEASRALGGLKHPRAQSTPQGKHATAQSMPQGKHATAQSTPQGKHATAQSTPQGKHSTAHSTLQDKHQSTPQDKHHPKSQVEKTPSPQKPIGGGTTPLSLEKKSRRQKLQNLFQSPKSGKQSPPLELKNIRQSPRLSSRFLSESPTIAQGKSPRSRMSHRHSQCEKLMTASRSENIVSVHHSPGKSSTQEDSVRTNCATESAPTKSQDSQPMDTDNESIFSDLSQGFDTKTNVHVDLSSPFTRKRSLRLSPENSDVFSPSKRRRVQLQNLDTNRNSSLSYCLHTQILSGRADSFGSNSSQRSQGFATEASQSQKSQASLSQSSIDSNDYFSLSNDEVFLCRRPETSRSDSPVFGSAKKDKHRSIIYNAKPIIVDDLSASAGLVSEDSTMVSPRVTRTRRPYCTSPNVTGYTVPVSPCVPRTDVSKSPYVARKGSTPSSTAFTKLSPSNRKYSPNVSAKSLMHLINSPLVTSPDGEEQSPQLHSLNVKRRRTHGKSKRSLDLHK